MGHDNVTSEMTPEQKKFFDLNRRGDDFTKIEIYRNALDCYHEALEMNIDNDMVKPKIAFCDSKLSFERKIIYSILIVSFIALSFFFVLLKQ